MQIAIVRQVANASPFEIMWRMPFVMIPYLEAQARRYVGQDNIRRQDNPDKIKAALELVKKKVKNNG